MSTRDRRCDEDCRSPTRNPNRDIDARLARLPREIPPRRDLWPEIARSLESVEPDDGANRRRPKPVSPFGALWRGPAVLVATGLAAAVFATALLVPRTGTGGAPGDSRRPAAVAGEIGRQAGGSGATGEPGSARSAGDAARSRGAEAGRLTTKEPGEATPPPAALRRQTASPAESAPRTTVGPPLAPPEAVVAVDLVPESDRRTVRRLIDQRLAVLPPETVREVRASLAALDAAAREVEAGVAVRPADVGTRLLQAELVRRELELLGRLQTAEGLVAG